MSLSHASCVSSQKHFFQPLHTTAELHEKFLKEGDETIRNKKKKSHKFLERHLQMSDVIDGAAEKLFLHRE